ncbi:MAG: Ig-like domain-containing protein, partial [Pirellulaceae bacterium]
QDVDNVQIDITNVNDAPAGTPTITGTATEDQTLTADTSGISDADGLGSFSYQWLRDGANITGATAITYTLGDADVGTQISVQVSYTDGEGTAEGPLTSAQTAAVTNVNDAPAGSSTITGTPTEDQTLTADTSGISDADGLGTFSYQWLRDGGTIIGATSSTYTLGDADVGTQISVEVSYTDGEGTAEGPLTSAQTAAVTNINDAPAGSPTITGTVTEDQTLSADTSGISDADGLGSFGYQWLRDGANITGATASTYTLGDADVGSQISVEVSYTDGEGTAEGPLTSAQTTPVANVNDAPTLTSFAAVVDATSEDTEVEISFADLAAQGNEADIDGTVTAFTINNVNSGTLRIGMTAWTATAWTAGINDTVDATLRAYWTPDTNVNGTQNAFEAVATDDGGLDSVGNVIAQVAVSPDNDAPVGVDDNYVFNEDNAFGDNVLSNDTDADPGDTLTAVLTGDAANGSLSLQSDGSFVYTPNLNFNGLDQFTYQVFDGTTFSSITTVGLSINPVNDAPTTNSESVTIPVGGSYASNALNGVLSNDVDVDGDVLTAVLVSGPSSGNLTLNTDGSWSYTPLANFSGTTSFTYVANDGTVSSSPQTVTIVVALGYVPNPDPNGPTGGDGGGSGGWDPDGNGPNDGDGDDDGDDGTGADNIPGLPVTPEYTPRSPDSKPDAPNRTDVALQDVADFDARQPDELDSLVDLNFDVGDPSYRNVQTLLFSSEEIARLNFVIEDQDLISNIRNSLLDADERDAEMQNVAGAATCVFIGAATGMAIWSMSGTYLASLALSSLPMWASFDPIYIVTNPTRLSKEDDESVAEIITLEHNAMEASP